MPSFRNTFMMLALGLSLWRIAQKTAVSHAADDSRFTFFHEFYGARGYTDPEARQHLESGIANGLTFSPPVESGVVDLVKSSGAKLMLRLPGVASPAGLSNGEIEKQRDLFGALATQNPQIEFTWDLLPEWDQSGGSWVSEGRPQYTDLSRSDAHRTFTSYYQRRFPSLMDTLLGPADSRKYRLAAVTDYAVNTFDAYQMGVDLCLLERGVDELGDLSTGIAFLRGAAQQYGRAWGIDLSSWRTSTGMATQYSNSNVLQGGWSANYLMRHYYASFYAGANVIQNEAALYRNQDGKPNPFLDATQEFADFALRRHTDAGSPVVPMAFLIDRDSGFDPKHGAYNQSNAVWYQDIPYSSGDFMIDNLLRLAYPNHWLHGLAPSADFADRSGVPDQGKFRAFLAAGGDPRPYEPAPSTRWGDNLDILTTDVRNTALSRYKVIVLLGDVHLDARLRSDLRSWVQNGGVFVINAQQMSSADEDLVGSAPKGSSLLTAASSQWLPNGAIQAEPSYRYTPMRAVTAQVLAVNELSDPLITRQKIGQGEVLLTTASYLQSSAQDRMLEHATQLFDSLMAKYSVARISGPPIEYIVSRSSGRTVVGLINNSSAMWTGDVRAAYPNATAASGCTVLEYVSDQPVPFERSSAGQESPAALIASAQVSPYGVRVFAFECDPPSTARALKAKRP
jgi:hypothetical protein